MTCETCNHLYCECPLPSGLKRRHIAVDLDGTLAEYHGWVGPTHIGKPIPDMVRAVKQALAAGHKVSIFTARLAGDHGDEEYQENREAIGKWCEEHLGKRLPMTATKHGWFTDFWDDRAVGFERNVGFPTVDVKLRGLFWDMWSRDDTAPK